jgi:DNA-binding CsgD family transcriptional regulator
VALDLRDPADELPVASSPARAARGVLDQLSEDLSDARVAVVLADRRGRVVEHRVSDPTLGAAIDGVLATTRLVRGSGPDTAVRGVLASASAPIVDPGTGRLVGLIEIVCFVADESALMQPLVTRAAREIELRLVDDAGVSRRLVLQRFLQERRRAKGPLVVITDASMITNAAASRLLASEDEAILRVLAQRLTSEPGAGEPSRLELSDGSSMMVRAEPILDGPIQLGAVLRLWPVAATAREAAPRRRADRPTFGWESLTDAERAVTDLVAEGLTNRDIGRRLFLSHHTVGFHLRSIFRKLDIGSRVELARLVTERELAYA